MPIGLRHEQLQRVASLQILLPPAEKRDEARIHEDRLTVQPDKEQRLAQILHDSTEPRLGVGQCPELLFERLPHVLQS